RALHIEAVDVTAVLENDRVLARGRELDVELGEVGAPRHFLEQSVVRVEVEPHLLAAVREEVHLRADEHRDDVLRGVVCELRRLLRGEVVEPDVIAHPTAIALPGAELAEDAVERELLAVGRIAREPAPREWQLFREAAFGRYGVKLAD